MVNWVKPTILVALNEWKNIDLIKLIIKTVDRLLGREEGASDKAHYLCC